MFEKKCFLCDDCLNKDCYVYLTKIKCTIESKIFYCDDCFGMIFNKGMESVEKLRKKYTEEELLKKIDELKKNYDEGIITKESYEKNYLILCHLDQD